MIAVILAGGLGQRLRPFTSVIPKPLLPVGESSVLEIQLLTLQKHGVKQVYIATNYLSDVVKAYIGDGSRFGLSVQFSHERKLLGTCGPLSLLRDKLTEPFVLMNGDILTTLDFRKAYDVAQLLDADLTIATKEVITPFSFGKVLAENNYVVDVQEKPDIKFEILAGIYFMKPPVLSYVPDDTFYNMDSLIRDILKSGKRVGRHLMTEYWLDIGTAEHYEDAQTAYKEHFGELKGAAAVTSIPAT
jgi:NDP-sugar pyrophosphorylase family protein